MTIQDIIQGCKRQERKAQHLLYERYIQQMYRIALRFLGNKEDTEDVVYESFMKIYEKVVFFHYQEINSFEVWMKRIVINQSLSAIRKRNKFKLVELGGNNEVGSVELFDNIDTEAILKLIVSLPDGYRIVFNLYAIEGYSHAEIANLLNISESTSKSQLFKARKLLKKWLADEAKTKLQ